MCWGFYTKVWPQTYLWLSPSLCLSLLPMSVKEVLLTVLSLVDDERVDRVGNLWLGFDQLCWHNFRIIGTYLSGISIEHYSRIIGSRDTFKGVVLGVVYSIPHDWTKHVGPKKRSEYFLSHRLSKCTKESYSRKFSSFSHLLRQFSL